MNVVNLVARLTKDPEVRYNPNTQSAVAKFSLAVDDGYGDKKKTYFIPVTVFGKQAESCEKYLAKGRRVAITGRLVTGSYEKDGKKIYTWDVIADRVEFLEFGEKKEEPAPDGFAYIDNEEDVPF